MTRWSEAGDTHANGHQTVDILCVWLRERKNQPLDVLSNLVGGLTLDMWQQDDKFLSPVAGHQLPRSASGLCQGMSQQSKAFVTGNVAIEVVELLEMIDVEYDECNRHLSLKAALPCLVQ
ncbi:hypothetical protein D3C77_444600 [compost metagenome]